MESDRDKTLQVMARALFQDGLNPPGGCGASPWEIQTPAIQAAHRRKAEAALTALEASGRVAVPVALVRDVLREVEVSLDADADPVTFGRVQGLLHLLPPPLRESRGAGGREMKPWWREITINQHSFRGWTPERDGKADRSMESAEARSAVANSKPVVKEDSE